jgi:hypothetical protein
VQQVSRSTSLIWQCLMLTPKPLAYTSASIQMMEAIPKLSDAPLL